MNKTCDFVATSVPKNRKDSIGAGVVRKANALIGYLNTKDYDELIRQTEHPNSDRIIKSDVISFVTGGIFTSKEVLKTEDSKTVVQVNNYLDRLIGAVTAWDNKGLLDALNHLEDSEELMNSFRFTDRSQKIDRAPYNVFNLQKKFGFNFDIHGAYKQILIHFPGLNVLDEWLKSGVERGNHYGRDILIRINKTLKGAEKEILSIDGELNNSRFLDRVLKFFDASMDNHYDSNRYHDEQYMLKQWYTFLSDNNIEVDFKQDVDYFKNLFVETRKAAEELWRINYGTEIADKMIAGDYSGSATWDQSTRFADMLSTMKEGNYLEIGGQSMATDQIMNSMDPKSADFVDPAWRRSTDDLSAQPTFVTKVPSLIMLGTEHDFRYREQKDYSDGRIGRSRAFNDTLQEFSSDKQYSLIYSANALDSAEDSAIRFGSPEEAAAQRMKLFNMLSRDGVLAVAPGSDRLNPEDYTSVGFRYLGTDSTEDGLVHLFVKAKESLTMDSIKSDPSTILGLQKEQIRYSLEMYEKAKQYLPEEDIEHFREVIEKMTTADVKKFYLPKTVDPRTFTHQSMFHNNENRGNREEINPAAFMKFLYTRESETDMPEVTPSMAVASLQRIETMNLAFNTFTHQLFSKAAMAYADTNREQIPYTSYQAIKKYASNVLISGSPRKELSIGKERFKQIMRLNSIFPALIIAGPASGIRNLVAAGMGLFNADWHGFAWNSDFDKALKDSNKEHGSAGWVAEKINAMVEAAYTNPGLATIYQDNHKFLEIQTGITGMKSQLMVDRILDRLENNLMKFADWSVNGYFLKNLKWYHDTFTVTGGEKRLRSQVKNMIFQSVMADKLMIENLRSSNTAEIQHSVSEVLEKAGSMSQAEIDTAFKSILHDAKYQQLIGRENKNQELEMAYTRLISGIENIQKSDIFNIEGFKSVASEYLSYKARITDQEMTEVIDKSARYWKAIVDKQLGDFSPAGKPYIENLMLRDADTYAMILFGGILKAASFFNVVGRTSSIAYLQGLHLTAGTMMGNTGREVAGWESGIKGMTSFEYGGSATVTVGLGTVMIIYGMLAGLFNRNVMIGSALSMNPMSQYVPPARLMGMEAFHLYGVLSGLGVSVPPEIREQVYQDNLRWAAGAIAGKSVANLYQESVYNGKPANPVDWIQNKAMDLFDLPDLISHGLRDIQMQDDLKQYYDWRKQFQNTMVPINHLKPVFLAQKAVETLVDISAPKDERGTRVMTNNIGRSLANWFGLAVWTQVYDGDFPKPRFQDQRVQMELDHIEGLASTRRFSRPQASIPRERLMRLHKRLRRYNTAI